MPLITVLYTVLIAAALTAAAAVMLLIFRRRGYQNSEYQRITGHSYGEVRGDTGLYGEYLIYRYLQPLQGHKRFLFNICLPGEHGTNSKIDILLLHESGIYVFDSRNSSGRIFGAEDQKQWTQTRRANGKTVKTQFYNPIMKNEAHIKKLMTLLPEALELPVYSCVLFSNRCRLVKIAMTRNRAEVLRRRDVLDYMHFQCRRKTRTLTEGEIESLYLRLYTYSQVSPEVRAKHAAFAAKIRAGAGGTAARYCPRCGKKMVKRTAVKGPKAGKAFWSCSGFPKCRETVSAEKSGESYKKGAPPL